jgi:anti-sigma factor RsiW
MSDLTCEAFVEMLTERLDGALDPETRRRFADHLPTCPGCERYLSQFRYTTRMLRGLAPPSTDAATRLSLDVLDLLRR